MKTILFPTDFSDNAANALSYALEFSRKMKAKLVLFHSYVVPVLSDDLPVIIAPDEVLKEEAQTQMDALLKRIRQSHPDVQVESLLNAGYAESEIVRTVASQNADLLVMGTQGASGLREVLIGSITAAVMEDAACPVLAVPEKAPYSGLRKAVFATNYADNDFENIENVIELAKPFNAEVILLHVSNGELDTAYEFAAIETFKERIRSDSQYEKISFKLLEHRDVSDGISLYLDEVKADLIAMSMHQRSFFQRMFNRSKTKRMAFHTHVPLLVFHAAEQ